MTNALTAETTYANIDNENRDEKMKVANFQRQLKAIHAWGWQKPQDLLAKRISTKQ